MDKWLKEIEESVDGNTKIDIAIEFEKLIARNIVHISFGEDISDMIVETDIPDSPGSTKFIRKKLTLSEATHNAVFTSMG